MLTHQSHRPHWPPIMCQTLGADYTWAHPCPREMCSHFLQASLFLWLPSSSIHLGFILSAATQISSPNADQYVVTVHRTTPCACPHSPPKLNICRSELNDHWKPALTVCYQSQWPLSLAVQWLKLVSWIKSLSLPPACVLGFTDFILGLLGSSHVFPLLISSEYLYLLPAYTSSFPVMKFPDHSLHKGVSSWLKILLGLLNTLQIKRNSRMAWPALHTHPSHLLPHSFHLGLIILNRISVNKSHSGFRVPASTKKNLLFHCFRTHFPSSTELLPLWREVSLTEPWRWALFASCAHL